MRYKLGILLFVTVLMLTSLRHASAVYDPSEGRWLSRDPIGEVDGINLYAYVRNSPIARVDRFGLEGEDITESGAEEEIDLIMNALGLSPASNGMEFPVDANEIMKTPEEEATQEHHSDPKFLGGNPNQPTTTMPKCEHIQLHLDLNEFLSQIKDDFGNNMRRY